MLLNQEIASSSPALVNGNFFVCFARTSFLLENSPTLQVYILKVMILFCFIVDSAHLRHIGLPHKYFLEVNCAQKNSYLSEKKGGFSGSEKYRNFEHPSQIVGWV